MKAKSFISAMSGKSIKIQAVSSSSVSPKQVVRSLLREKELNSFNFGVYINLKLYRCYSMPNNSSGIQGLIEVVVSII